MTVGRLHRSTETGLRIYLLRIKFVRTLVGGAIITPNSMMESNMKTSAERQRKFISSPKGQKYLRSKAHAESVRKYNRNVRDATGIHQGWFNVTPVSKGSRSSDNIHEGETKSLACAEFEGLGL